MRCFLPMSKAQRLDHECNEITCLFNKGRKCPFNDEEFVVITDHFGYTPCLPEIAIPDFPPEALDTLAYFMAGFREKFGEEKTERLRKLIVERLSNIPQFLKSFQQFLKDWCAS